MRETLHITNELNQLLLLDSFLVEAANDYQFDGRLLMDIKLVLEEMVTNIILYAYPGETGKEISISLTCENRQLKISITDSGIPFNPLEKPEPDLTLPLEERPIGGLGIYLAKQLMTEMKYNRSEGKNIVIMIKNIN